MIDKVIPKREYLKGIGEEERSYSIAVSAFGKTTIYVSGIAGWEDETGNPSLEISRDKRDLFFVNYERSWKHSARSMISSR